MKKKMLVIMISLLLLPQISSSMRAESRRWYVPEIDKKQSVVPSKPEINQTDINIPSHKKHFLEEWFAKGMNFTKDKMPTLNEFKRKVYVLEIDVKSLKLMKQFKEKATKDFVVVPHTGFQVIKQQDVDWEKLGINPKEFE